MLSLMSLTLFWVYEGDSACYEGPCDTLLHTSDSLEVCGYRATCCMADLEEQGLPLKDFPNLGLPEDEVRLMTHDHCKS